MRLGLVGWPSDTGVGMEIRDAIRYLPTDAVYFMNHPGKPMSDEFKDKTVGDYDLTKKMESFIDQNRIDTILTWETPGHWDFPALWERKGIQWNCVVHWDWFAPKQIPAWKTANILVPFAAAMMGLKMIYGLDSTVIPVPVDLDRLPFRAKTKAENFVTVFAMGGAGDRRSIGPVVEAWRLMGTDAPPLTIFAQKDPPELKGIELPTSIKMKLGVVPQARDLYQEADVAVMPSKYEGVGLSLIEAQACGLPVITTNMEPMRSLAPDYLVDGEPGEIELMQGHKLQTCCPSAAAIAARVMEIAHKGIRDESLAARRRVEDNYSWSTLKELWIGILEAA